MLNHEAVLCTIHPKAKILHIKLDHKRFLYRKGNIDGIKVDMVKLQDMFMSNNPYSRTVKDNWNLFKSSTAAG